MNRHLTHTPAGRVRRFLAALIDMLPIYILCFLAAFLLTDFSTSWYNRRDPFFRTEYLWQQTLVRVFSFIVYILYASIMEASVYHATLGKKIMRLEVCSDKGAYLSFQEAFMRNLNKIVSCAILGLGILWILLDRQKLAWHDILSKTMVVNRRLNLPSEAAF